MGKPFHPVLNADSFAVAPRLVGARFASRASRLVAMVIDLVLCGLLVALASSPGLFFATVACVAFFRWSRRWQPQGEGAARARLGRVTAGLALFAAILVVTGAIDRRLGSRSGEEPGAWVSSLQESDGRDEGVDPDPDAAAALAVAHGLMASLEGGEDDPQAFSEALRAAVSEAVERSEGSGAGEQSPSGEAATRTPGPRPSDGVVPASATIGAAGADARELERLRRRNARLLAEVARLERQVEASEEGSGLVSFLVGTLQDLGLGIGWMGLYFIAFLVLWKGQTPGKRMLGIRVVRLDGEPIGWWSAFDRFHGYVSCLMGGLLGFMQVLWDPHRMGHHDRGAGTVVVEAYTVEPRRPPTLAQGPITEPVDPAPAA